MSKSAGEKHYINVFSDESRIRRQVRSAVTDTGDVREGELSPGVANLFELLKASGKSEIREALMADYHNGCLRYADLKDAVADALIEISTAVRHRRTAINEDKKAVKEQIKESSAQIRKRAQETVREVKELSGLMNVKVSL
jgi:tryptophanyl-tRNA synthetase